ncbi:hypothetical protein F5X97DRAFT_305072 [Nemania serpens]|nr:hypothetical protein F5X97DRAFT_305072 [Nemania serpens]
MDIYGAASTALTQVIQVTIFIKSVVSDIKAYENDRKQIQLRLDIQLVSLEFFGGRFLDEKHGLLLVPGALSDRAANAICDLLLKMNTVLAEYHNLVSRFELFDDLQPGPPEGSSGEDWKQRSFDRLTAKFKTLKLKGYHWALFEKKKLLAVLAEYKEWTDSLRDIMQHFTQEAVYSMAGKDALVSSTSLVNLRGTGLEPVARRQLMAATHAPEDFSELEGQLTIRAAPQGTKQQSNPFQIGEWAHNGHLKQVVVEYHEYPRELRGDDEDLEPDEIVELKQPVRDLVWLLQNSAFAGNLTGDEEAEQQPTIYSLQCLGYKDQAEEHRFVFVHQLPLSVESGGEALITLHELINKVDSRTRQPFKPSLGSRFGIAHCLALTLLNVHSSRWIHKNIRSSGVLLFQEAESGGIEPFDLNPAHQRATKTLAFLGDWGYARPIGGVTEMRGNFEVESNLYRHPDRQGVPNREFSRKYDIYALGVVLLEIGMWRTVSQLFDQRIKEANLTGKLPKAKTVYTTLLSLAQTHLSREMGDQYATAVVACLTNEFSQVGDVELSLDFRDKVVDPIALGMKL